MTTTQKRVLTWVLLMIIVILVLGCGDDESGFIQRDDPVSVSERIERVCGENSHPTALAEEQYDGNSGTIAWIVVCSTGQVHRVKVAR